MTLMQRRRALMGAKEENAPSYITNGLLLHLDAIDNAGTGVHDSAYFNWVNLANKNQIFQQSPSGSKIAFHDKFFDFNGANYFSFSSEYRKWSSMEIVYVADSSSTEAIFQSYSVSDSSTGPIGCISQKSNSILFGGGGALSVAKKTGIHTYACDGTNVYVDGVKMSASNVTITFSGNPSSWIVGTWRSLSYKCTGKIYALRGYSRKLTADEFANNAMVDALRFA